MAIKVTAVQAARGTQDKAIATVDMGDGTTQQIAFWPELVGQWTGSATDAATALGAYIVACAQWAAGQYAAARTTLQPHATGAAGPPDTRNWAQQWIDQHPDPAPYAAPVPY